MDEQWTLPIEDKVLLAEKVMGWSNRKPRHRTKEGETCFWVDKLNTLLYMRQDYGEGVYSWYPETDVGDAAELMLALPQVEFFTFDGYVKASMKWYIIYESKSFCETICCLALAYIRKSQAIL